MLERRKVSVGFGADNPKAKNRTKSEHRDDCDINKIVQRYKRQGQFSDGDLTKKKPFFGDVCMIPDFQSLVNIVATVQETFKGLPAETKSRFRQDPSLVIDFLSDEKNHDEARELGLLPPLTREEIEARELAKKEEVAETGDSNTPGGGES